MEACAQLMAMHNAGAMPDPARGVLGSVCHAGIMMGWEHSRPLEGRLYMYKTFDTPGGRVLILASFLEDCVRCMTVVVTFTKGMRARHVFRPGGTSLDTSVSVAGVSGAVDDQYSCFDPRQAEFLRDLHAGLDNMTRHTIPPCSILGNNVSCHGHTQWAS